MAALKGGVVRQTSKCATERRHSVFSTDQHGELVVGEDGGHEVEEWSPYLPQRIALRATSMSLSLMLGISQFSALVSRNDAYLWHSSGNGIFVTVS
jgi:hypothetical protein